MSFWGTVKQLFPNPEYPLTKFLIRLLFLHLIDNFADTFNHSMASCKKSVFLRAIPRCCSWPTQKPDHWPNTSDKSSAATRKQYSEIDFQSNGSVNNCSFCECVVGILTAGGDCDCEAIEEWLRKPQLCGLAGHLVLLSLCDCEELENNKKCPAP